MTKKSGSNRMKRLSAPRQWNIGRKGDRFAFKPSPGPYSTEGSYPLGTIVRDILGMVDDARELRRVITSGQIMVDGVPRKSLTFPVGLFNVVEVPKEGVAFRMVPSPDGLLTSRVMSAEDSKLKLCRVKSKVKSKGGHMQYGFHDGRSMLEDNLKISPGDAVLMKLPEQSIVSTIRLTKGSLGLIISGERAGQLAKIVDVKKGMIGRESMTVLSLPKGDTEIPSRMVFPVGTESPVIGLEAGN